jgi:23S rRNA pseudouridine2457 synthase
MFRPEQKYKYIAFYKPYDVVCQFGQAYNSQKQTLAEFGFPKSVYPVGRLDSDSEGLLILSDDNRLNQALLLPKHSHQRIYLVQVENIPQEKDLDLLAKELVIGDMKTKPAYAKLLDNEPKLPERNPPIRKRLSIPTCWLEILLSEGKNRQVRKMTAHIGYPTLRLVRSGIGKLNVFDLNLLQPGQIRHLTAEEVTLLFK